VDELQRTLNASRAQILIKSTEIDQQVNHPAVNNNNGNGHHPQQ